MNTQKQILTATVLLFVSFGFAFTAKGQTPTGAEVARAARSLKLDKRNSTTGERDGMKVTVTPADLAKVKAAQLERGVIIAVVDVTGRRNGGNGRHHVFATKAAERWRVFLESNGQVTEVKDVQVTESRASEQRFAKVQLDVPMPSCWCAPTICVGTGLNKACLYKICNRCE